MAPLTAQIPALVVVNVTGSPDVAVAVSGTGPSDTAVGGGAVNVTACAAGAIRTVRVTRGAGAHCGLPGWSARMMRHPRRRA